MFWVNSVNLNVTAGRCTSVNYDYILPRLYYFLPTHTTSHEKGN